MTNYGIESGIAIVAARVRDFRSLANIEVTLGDFTVLIGANNAGKTSFLDALFAAIGAGRRSLNAEDVRLASGESHAPRTRSVVIDVLLRPIGVDGKVLNAFPEGSFWTELWGASGIATDDEVNEFTGIRTTLKWSDARGEYALARHFLKEWKAFTDDWATAATHDRAITAAQIEPLALHYIDAQRDLEQDLRTPGSFWRRLTQDFGLSTADVEQLESALTDINGQIVAKSAILKHLKDNLTGLQTVVASEGGTVDVAPIARKLRDLSKGVDVTFNTDGAQSFPLVRHGMGTRSLAALLVFRAYASWRNKRATDAGDKRHSVLALEEPESHLHPQAQRSLFAHVKQVPGQRIVSTHSPYFAGQAPLEDLRLFFKRNGDTIVTSLDTGSIEDDDLRKLQDTVIDTRGDILFSRGVVFFEGQTEEQSLPVYAEKYWGASVHELGFCFVRVNGTDYFPFIWLAKALRICWYIFADGEVGPVRELNSSLKKAKEADASRCPNIVVLPRDQGLEPYLVSEGYLSEIEQAIDALEGVPGYLTKYIDDMQGRLKKKGKVRDYRGSNGRELAAIDYLEGNKTASAKLVASKISSSADASRRFPMKVRELFEIVSRDLGLLKAGGSLK